jgi:hypothetical protein
VSYQLESDKIENYFTTNFYEGGQLCDRDDIVITATYDPDVQTLSTGTSPVSIFKDDHFIWIYATSDLYVGTYNLTISLSITDLGTSEYELSQNLIMILTVTEPVDTVVTDALTTAFNVYESENSLDSN